jgi:OHCU decarboxylase
MSGGGDGDASTQGPGDERGAGGAVGVERLNGLPGDEAFARLLECCGSTRWAQTMAVRRPYADERQLIERAERVWWGLTGDDWLEAFRAHPQIGETRPARDTGEGARRWSEEEQAGARAAAAETLDALAEANRTYQERFGHIFIVCATGRSSAEMLDALRRRLSNDPDTELCVAAEQQRRITLLRLRKLLAISC